MKIDFNQIDLDINNGRYPCIGKGSGRTVFNLENGFVIKVARNKKGIAQNKVEYQIGSTANTSLFGKISSISEDSRFLIMEKAEKIGHISYDWNYFNVRNNRALFQIKELQDIASKYNLLLVDFGRSANWGKINNKPVIIDYGFTQQVKKKFY